MLYTFEPKYLVWDVWIDVVMDPGKLVLFELSSVDSPYRVQYGGRYCHNLDIHIGQWT